MGTMRKVPKPVFRPHKKACTAESECGAGSYSLDGHRDTVIIAIETMERCLWRALLLLEKVVKIMIETMQVGDERSYRRVITKSDTLTFGTVTGDMNPAHFDDAYCLETRFKKPIVHGMYLGSLFSKIFGLDYPGEGTIYCKQSLTFLKPVFVDSEIDVVVRVTEVDQARNRVTFSTKISVVGDDSPAVVGEAMLMPPKERAHG